MNNIQINANSNPKRGARGRGRLAAISRAIGSAGAGRALPWLSLTAVGLTLVSCAMPLSGAALPFLYVVLLAIGIAGYAACSSGGGGDSGGGDGDDNGNQTPTPTDNNGNPTPTPTPMERVVSPDIFVVSIGSNQVYLGDGTGSFSDPTDLPGEDRDSLEVALGDLNEDGNLDAVVVNYGETNQVYLGDGTGGFDAPTDLETDANTRGSRGVAIGDLDGQ